MEDTVIIFIRLIAKSLANVKIFLVTFFRKISYVMMDLILHVMNIALTTLCPMISTTTVKFALLEAHLLIVYLVV